MQLMLFVFTNLFGHSFVKNLLYKYIRTFVRVIVFIQIYWDIHLCQNFYEFLTLTHIFVVIIFVVIILSVTCTTSPSPYSPSSAAPLLYTWFSSVLLSASLLFFFFFLGFRHTTTKTMSMMMMISTNIPALLPPMSSLKGPSLQLNQFDWELVVLVLSPPFWNNLRQS